ncbi:MULTISPECIES: hypothetical protein [Legionella]|uniref:Uncharacterized protein n=1 Tax=Legionella maceachernii TaxID=466 RepID=A0A0W0W6L7_9GAMM|nr:hypothetical protein [Legionella maceachernii]KTD28052.1 hypothetical protein Lmac_1111 [Legionella maceachernii]SKA07629.1 hypothetical protein SAMN02745128_02001 [Legionella maceachernii]SUO99803.1 Uncharacterised protein [Legionella maceachernii]
MSMKQFLMDAHICLQKAYHYLVENKSENYKNLRLRLEKNPVALEHFIHLNDLAIEKLEGIITSIEQLISESSAKNKKAATIGNEAADTSKELIIVSAAQKEKSEAAEEIEEANFRAEKNFALQSRDLIKKLNGMIVDLNVASALYLTTRKFQPLNDHPVIKTVRDLTDELTDILQAHRDRQTKHQVDIYCGELEKEQLALQENLARQEESVKYLMKILEGMDPKLKSQFPQQVEKATLSCLPNAGVSLEFVFKSRPEAQTTALPLIEEERAPSFKLKEKYQPDSNFRVDDPDAVRANAYEGAKAIAWNGMTPFRVQVACNLFGYLAKILQSLEVSAKHKEDYQLERKKIDHEKLKRLIINAAIYLFFPHEKKWEEKERHLIKNGLSQGTQQNLLTQIQQNPLHVLAEVAVKKDLQRLVNKMRKVAEYSPTTEMSDTFPLHNKPNNTMDKQIGRYGYFFTSAFLKTGHPLTEYFYALNKEQKTFDEEEANKLLMI